MCGETYHFDMWWFGEETCLLASYHACHKDTLRLDGLRHQRICRKNGVHYVHTLSTLNPAIAASFSPFLQPVTNRLTPGTHH